VSLVLGAFLFFVASLAGFLNANVVNGERFAEHVNQMRQDPSLAAAIGDEVASLVIDAKPDLIAVQPAIESAAATVVASTAFSGVFTSAVSSFHSALTESGSNSAVLTVADIGSAAVSLLEAVAPDLAANVPGDLDITLAQIGGQEGPAAIIIPVFQAVTALALVLPVLAIGLWVLGVWLAPDRRMAILRVGWALVAVAAALAVFGVLGWVVSRLVSMPALESAVLESAADVFGQALAVRVLVTAMVGGLMVVAASALLPQVHVHERVDSAVRRLVQRPVAGVWALTRALVLIAVGVGFIFFPSIALAVVSVVVGIAVFLIGVGELDLIAERSLQNRQGADAETGAWKWAWLVPVGAGAVAVVLLAAVLLPTALPQSTQVVAAIDSQACNGHVELCDRPYSEVAFPATHNAMSAADQPGWFLAEQPTTMVQSLDDGIRVFLIDTWYGQPTESGGVITAERSLARAQSELTSGKAQEISPAMQRTINRLRGEQTLGPVEVFMCHTLCELGATSLTEQLDGLKAWMDSHPREVVTVFIQDATTPQDTAEVFEQAGLADLAYVHQPGAQWPTLQQMIDSGKRLVVLMENESGGTRYPYLQQGFDLVQDTGYTYATVDDFDCAPNRGRKDAQILLVNHWLSSFTRLVSNAQKANAEDILGTRVRSCQAEREMMPNYVAVNWYDQGDLMQVVDDLNGLG
jgi:hypothetical protein